MQSSDIVALVAIVIAAVSYLKARRAAAKLAALNDTLWELRYQIGELKGQLTRGGAGSAHPAESPPPPPAGFIPLTSLKR